MAFNSAQRAEGKKSAYRADTRENRRKSRVESVSVRVRLTGKFALQSLCAPCRDRFLELIGWLKSVRCPVALLPLVTLFQVNLRIVLGPSTRQALVLLSLSLSLSLPLSSTLLFLSLRILSSFTTSTLLAQVEKRRSQLHLSSYSKFASPSQLLPTAS